MKFLLRAFCVSGLLAAACVSGQSQGVQQKGDISATVDTDLSDSSAAVTVPVHHLNRFEYNNTVRDLLSTSLTPADTFPIDPVSGVFDNDANSLVDVTGTLFGLYNGAAKQLADEVTSLQPRWSTSVLAPVVGLQANPSGSPLSNWGWMVRGSFNVSLDVPQDDNATLSILAAGIAVNAPTPHMTVKVDGIVVTDFKVTAPIATPQDHIKTFAVKAGTRRISIAFDNQIVNNDTTSGTDSELGIGKVTLASTTITASPGYTKMLVCDPSQGDQATQAACWQKILSTFMQRAWRRPMTDAEGSALQARWATLNDALGSQLALNYTIRAALMSPNFLYRAARVGDAADSNGVARIDDYDLASRLSYFLWGSMPDEQLLQDAKAGLLRTDAGLRTEVARMLADSRITGLQKGFAAQWLQTRQLDQVAPDPAIFPAWDDELKDAFAGESLLFFNDYLSNQLPISTMLNPHFTFVNNRLAAHYGLASPNSSFLTKVPLDNHARGGLLSFGAWLTSTSVQTRTSPVKRGRFVLQNLQCINIPAPPPGIAPLPSASAGAPKTQRQLLDMHVQDTQCASCHNAIDPLGYGLETFDGIGAVRSLDSGLPIDATGNVNGQAFSGPAELAEILAVDPKFVLCMARQLFAYALNVQISLVSTAAVGKVVAELADQGNQLDALITLIVLSPQFRQPSNG